MQENPNKRKGTGGGTGKEGRSEEGGVLFCFEIVR